MDDAARLPENHGKCTAAGSTAAPLVRMQSPSWDHCLAAACLQASCRPTRGVNVAAERGHCLRQADRRLLAQHHEGHEDEELGGQGLRFKGWCGKGR